MFFPALTALRGLVFPPVCEGCGNACPVARPEPVCAACEERIRPAAFATAAGEKASYETAEAAFAYEEPLRTVLHAYKFGRRRALGSFLGRKLSAFALLHLAGAAMDAVVAVPAERSKTAERGFRPARELARAVSKTLGLPERSAWLGCRPGPAQTSLSLDERRENVRGRFYFRGDGGELRGRSVLLVDDVLTTGSTVSECARVLRDAGAASVRALCLARGRLK